MESQRLPEKQNLSSESCAMCMGMHARVRKPLEESFWGAQVHSRGQVSLTY